MQRRLRIVNELEQSGAMSRYAIGGAMGATFYIEPLLTFDLDIFTTATRYTVLDSRRRGNDG